MVSSRGSAWNVRYLAPRGGVTIKHIAKRVNVLALALVAVMVPALASAQTFVILGTELDATEAGVTALLALAGVFIVGWVTLRLFRRGTGQVK